MDDNSINTIEEEFIRFLNKSNEIEDISRNCHERSFTSIERSGSEEIYMENEEFIKKCDNDPFIISNQSLRAQFPPQNQNDAIKLFSSNFQQYCDSNHIKGVNDTAFPAFRSYGDIDEIIENPRFYMFLLKLVEFIELEINKFQYNEGIFTVLANKGYYDATVDRILQAFNDLIFINDNNQGHNQKPKISRYLDRSFLKFDDGMRRKFNTTYYTKLRSAIEGEKSQIKAKGNYFSVLKENISASPASNQNDALKIFFSHFQKFCSIESTNLVTFHKFYYFSDIKEGILKKRDFPAFMKKFVNFLQWEFGNYTQRKTGLYQTLYKRGYYDCTISRILTTFNHLIIIHNHIEHCMKCKKFYIKPTENLKPINMSFLTFEKGPIKKICIKTAFSNWVFAIKEGNCEGFKSLDGKIMKIDKKSKGI